jgi:hypothetical protein
MLRVDKIIKPWKESAALNDHINLYGFWNETTFLTKSGDVGSQRSRRGLRESRLLGAGICGEAIGGSTEGVQPRLPCLPISLQIQLPDMGQ